MKKILSAVLLLCLWLTGCTNIPQSKSFDESMKIVPHGRDVIVSVPQSEANVNVDASNLAGAMGGGLIFAFIDLAIDKSSASAAETTIKPIRAALIDYDFEQNSLEAVKLASSKVNWLSANGIAFTKDATDENFAKLMDVSSASQIMYNNFDYAFSGDFKALNVGLRTTVVPKSVPLPDEKAAERLSYKKAAYYGKWIYTAYLPSPNKEARINAERWAENHGALARDALNKGIVQVTQDLVSDLQKDANVLGNQVSGAPVPSANAVRSGS
jgi:hypothetical protein